jgi:hypothetical protein
MKSNATAFELLEEIIKSACFIHRFIKKEQTKMDVLIEEKLLDV